MYLSFSLAANLGRINMFKSYSNKYLASCTATRSTGPGALGEEPVPHPLGGEQARGISSHCQGDVVIAEGTCFLFDVHELGRNYEKKISILFKVWP